VRRPCLAVGWGTADPGRRTFRSLEGLSFRSDGIGPLLARLVLTS